MTDQRAYERFHADMIFWIKLLGSDEDFQPFRIENISGGGILAVTDHAYPLGAQVALSFELPQHPELIEAEAVVRHSQCAEADEWHIGLQFSQVARIPISLLVEHLEELFK